MVTKLVIFAILASKHSGLLNAIFVYSEDITPSLGHLKARGISKMPAFALKQKMFSRTRIWGIKESQTQWFSSVAHKQVGSSGTKLFFFKLELLVLRP